nr:PAS domain-containing sensor histidine kinase [Prosthecomicrobium pneumaticum]
MLVLAAVLVGAVIAFAFLPAAAAQPFVLALLGLLSVVGVFTLFAAAIGLLRFGSRREGETIARAFLDGMSDGLVLADAEGRLVYANAAYARLTGAEGERDLRSVERAFGGDPVGSDAVFRLSRALREGRMAVEEVRLTRPLAVPAIAGARWYRIAVRPLALGDGSGRGAVSRLFAGDRRTLAVWQIADITADREQQETAFQELQHAIDYLDHAPAGFLSAEPDGRIVYLNATLADWLGIDLARFEPGGLRLRDIIRGDGAALLAAAEGTGESRTEIVDLDLLKRNGQSLPVRLLHRVPYADGAPGATRTIVLNRSRGGDVEDDLRAVEVRFNRFFNHTPFAIATIDRRGRIGRTNAPFLRLFGPQPGDGRRRFVDLVVEGDRSSLETALEYAFAGRSDMPPVDATVAADGARSVRFYISPIADASEDEDEMATAYALDMTDQRALELQLRQAQKMEAVGQLAGGIAHDFNNVLTAIIGFSDLLLTNHKASDPSFQDIMNIKQNANRAAGLVRQLLAFSRKQTMLPQVIAVGDLLSDVSVLLERLVGEKVKLAFVHGRDLWPIRADANQLEQVVINLAVNARDAMPKGGTLTIRTRNVAADEVAGFPYKSLPAADYVLLEVEDTGTGIPPEIQGRIFEPFFSTKEVGKGTGLGLATVYGIVRQTGGHIHFTTEAGRGTVFHIFVPRHVQAVPAKPKRAPDKPPEHADLTGSASILIVEDQEAIRIVAARALASRGYSVHEAASGLEALDFIRTSGIPVDLVVSDVVMPELDGPSLLRELRKDHPNLKIIFVSGYAEDAFARNLPPGEVFGFLPKPFTIKELVTAVKETLGQ